MTEFLRALNEPDGLRKLAQSAPSFTAERPAGSSGAKNRATPDTPSRAGHGTRPPAAPSPPAPSATPGPLDSALNRAMDRLNGAEPDDTQDKPSASKPAEEPDSVTALYEKLRREREARDNKPTIPIPPVPPRR